MKLKEYIKGKRQGKDANRLERKAMNDPFLQDAIDGFDSVEGDHMDTIQKLEQKVKKQSGKTYLFSSTQWKIIGMAASLALLVGIGVLLFRDNQAENPPALAMDSTSERIEKYAPQSEDLIFDKKEEKSFNRSLPKEEKARPVGTPKIQVNKEKLGDIEFSESDLMAASDLEEFREMEIEIEKLKDSIETKELLVKFDSVKIEKHPEMLAFEDVMEKKQESMPYRNMSERGEYLRSDKVHSSAKKSKINSFKEKDFKQYFEKNHTKNICGATEIEIKAEFIIDENGTPSKIEVKEATCEELEKEFKHLLENGPKWTTINERIRITIKLD